jgi:hypothetical protein
MAPGMTTQREADIMQMDAIVASDEMMSEFISEWFGERGIPDEHAQDVQPQQGEM